MGIPKRCPPGMEWSAWTNPILKIKGTILQILDFILGSRNKGYSKYGRNAIE